MQYRKFISLLILAITPIINAQPQEFYGDVRGTANNMKVVKVGGQTASNIAQATQAAISATSSDVPNTVVSRDSNGNFATNMITIDGNPTNGTDAATVAYVQQTSVLGLEPKGVAIAVATNQTTLSGSATIDGISVITNNVVLLNGQTTQTENGLWVVSSTGTWSRPGNFTAGSTAGNAYVSIAQGDTYGGSSWLCNTPTATIGSDSITFSIFNGPINLSGDVTQNISNSVVVSLANGSITATAVAATIDAVNSATTTGAPSALLATNASSGTSLTSISAPVLTRSGTRTAGPTSLTFSTNNLTAMTIDTAQNVIVSTLRATASPAYLTIQDQTGVDQLYLDSSGVYIPGLNKPGVVHSNAADYGLLYNALVSDSDIATATITNDKLANISSGDIAGNIVVRDATTDSFAVKAITLTDTNLSDLTSTSAVPKAYVDTVASLGLDPKAPAQVVSVNNTSLSGLPTIDGYALQANDRLLLVGQTNETQNGLWLASTSSWSRPLDFASGSEATAAYVLILQGTSYAGSSWLCNTPTATIGTNNITFVEFSLPSQVTGNNLGGGAGQIYASKSGQTLNFNTINSANSYLTVSTASNLVTLTPNAVNTNTPSTLVARDAYGNFSANVIKFAPGTTSMPSLTFSNSSPAGSTGISCATPNQLSFDTTGVERMHISPTGTVTINGLSTAGVVHNSAAGLLTSSLVTGSDIAATTITNANIANATITDAKLTTISTAGKVANSATTATSANTNSAIVARDSSGNFSAGTITASLTGNVTGNLTGNASGSAASFTGSLAGDVTGTQSTTSVKQVGGQTAANVALATVAANAATSADTVSTIVKRDSSGSFSASAITLSANPTLALQAATKQYVDSQAASTTLHGDVTGTTGASVVSLVGGQTAANVALATVAANAATNLNTANMIVKRDVNGAFNAYAITATAFVIANDLSANNILASNGKLAVAGLQSVTVNNGDTITVNSSTATLILKSTGAVSCTINMPYPAAGQYLTIAIEDVATDIAITYILPTTDYSIIFPVTRLSATTTHSVTYIACYSVTSAPTLWTWYTVSKW